MSFTSKIFIYSVSCSINGFFLRNFLRYVTKGKSQVYAIVFDVRHLCHRQSPVNIWFNLHILCWIKPLRHVKENNFALKVSKFGIGILA